MSDPTSTLDRRRFSSSGEERRTCWVCFGTDDDVPLPWIRPCKCKGTAKWIHLACLQRWIDEKQRDSPVCDVSCPQCNAKYNIIYPPMGTGMKSLDWMERMIHKACPWLAGGIVLGSLYWSAVTYGAVTVMQVLGHKEGLNVMEQADPLFLLIGLPAIPLGLIIAKLVRWEVAVLKLWRKYSNKIPLLGHILKREPTWCRQDDEVVTGQEYTSHSRVAVGAIIFPTIATLTGKIAFASVQSNFQRSLLGGITFFSIKGFLRMYYMQQSLNRRSQRTIHDYSDDP